MAVATLEAPAKRRPKIRISDAAVIGDNLKDFDHSAVFCTYVVDGHEVRGVHWSGKYNGSLGHLTQHLVFLIRKHKLDYITTTESQQPGVMNAIQEALAEEGLRWGTKRVGEYACLYDLSVFTAMPKFRPRVDKLTDTPERDDWQQMKVAYFNLWHKKVRRRFRLVVVHGPSGIESGSTFKPGRQSETATNGWPRLGKQLRKFKRRNWRVVQVVHADSNANHFLTFWLKWFQKKLGAKSMWSVRLPKKGTHAANRLIDVIWIYGAR